MKNKNARHSLKERFLHKFQQKYKKLLKKTKKSWKKWKSQGDSKEFSFKRRKRKNTLWQLSFPLAKIQKQRKPIFFLWIGIVFVAILAFVIFWPLLKIKSIYISREWHTINIEQAYESTDYIRGKNIFFIDTREIANRLQKSQPAINNIEFTFESLSSLSIWLRSYPIAFHSNGYIILTNGSVLRWENKIWENIPEISLSQDISEYALFKETLGAKEIKNMLILLEELPKNIPSFQIKEMVFHITEKELLLSNQVDTIFTFDLSGESIAWQIEKLAVFQKESEDITQKKYIYIDVRIPGKLFLCPYDEEYQCRQNLKDIYGDSIFNQVFSLSLQ